MPWFKVDDLLWGSAKWLSISPQARALWVTAGSYAMNHLTEGKIQHHVLPTLGGRPKDARELVDAGLWELHPEGWIFHDWLEYQPSRAQVLAERAAAKERQHRARERARQKREAEASRRDDAVTHGVTDGVSNGVSHAPVTPDVTGPPTRPDPTPNYSTTSTGSPTVPAGFVPQVIRAYVESAKDADMPAPEDSQAKVDRSARKLLGEGYALAIVIETARNAAVNGWTDLSTQMQRDAARVNGATTGTNGTKSTTDQRAGAALDLADRLEREQKAIAG